VTTHLTSFYERDPERTREDPFVPVAACRATDGGQVSIYPDGDGEDRIDCLACLGWLNDGDNRLLILDVGEWITRHAADHSIRYTDIDVTE
jgi:hypothetical protein